MKKIILNTLGVILMFHTLSAAPFKAGLPPTQENFKVLEERKKLLDKLIDTQKELIESDKVHAKNVGTAQTNIKTWETQRDSVDQEIIRIGTVLLQ